MKTLYDEGPDREFLNRIANLEHLKEIVPSSEQSAAAPVESPSTGSTFDHAMMNHPTVNAVMKRGGTPEDCVIALINRETELIQQIKKLEEIAPRKIKDGDGFLVWRCPTELIPEID